MPKVKSTETTTSEATSTDKEPAKPTGEHKSTSPFADFYEMWNALAKEDVGTTEKLFAVIKKLAKLSEESYFYSPAPLPTTAQKALADLLTEPIDLRREEDDRFRRKTIRQFKFYLQNQAEHSSYTHEAASLKWSEALFLLKAEVTLQGTDKMYKTQYPQTTVDSIFSVAKEASRDTWIKHQLIIGRKLPPKAANPSAEARALFNAKKFQWTRQQSKAYQDSQLQKPIKISSYAKGLGIDCNQSDGLFSIQVKGEQKSFTINPSSTMAWMILRLLVTADDGVATLFKGWAGAFSGNDNQKLELRGLIKPFSKSKLENNHRFLLKVPLK